MIRASALVWLALSACSVAALVSGVQGTGSRRGSAGGGTVSAQTGSKTAAAYDNATKLLKIAEADSVTPEGPILPGHRRSAKVQYRVRMLTAAMMATTDMLAQVKAMKASGEWREGLKYSVVGGETLTETEILHRLREMRDRAKSERDELEPKLAAAYRREFPGASDAQLAALDQYGLPIEIMTGKKRGESCWKFETDAAWPTTCWKKTGAVASHTEKAKPRPVAPAPEDEGAGGDMVAEPEGGGEPAGAAETAGTSEPAGGGDQGAAAEPKPAHESCVPDGAKTADRPLCCSGVMRQDSYNDNFCCRRDDLGHHGCA